MKKFLLPLILLAASVPATASDVTVTFTYDFTYAQICSVTVTVNCLSHFESGLIENGVMINPFTIPIPANSDNKVVNNITGAFTVPTIFGTADVGALMVARNGTGARVTSIPAVASGLFLPRAPTNFLLGGL